MEKDSINNKGKEIDLKKICSLLIKDKRKILIYCGIGAVVGIFVALGIKSTYKTQVVLAPESSGSGLASSVSSLASMVGMNTKTLSTDDAINPELYPDLMGSMEFLTSLFNVKVATIDGRLNCSYYDYLGFHQKKPWWSYPQLLLGKALKAIKGKPKNNASLKTKSFQLTEEQYAIASAIQSSVKCTFDKKTEVITIVVTAQDPLVSAIMADSVKSRLQVFITKYRTNKARNDLSYMENLYREQKARYEKARRDYSVYADANQELMLQSFKSKLDDLENEMQLQYNIYSQVAQQLQLARAKVQERTPAFTVVQNAYVPLKKSNMPRSFVVVVFVLLFFAGRACVVLYKSRDTLLQ